MSHPRDEETVSGSCSDSELERPDINIGYIVGYLLLLEAVALGAAFLFRFILARWNVTCSFELLHLVSVIMVLLPTAKITARLVIRIYQRYAPENVRRRCVCTPSCSNYALMALEKYNFFKAFRLIYIRLTRTCRGSEHIIDYP